MVSQKRFVVGVVSSTLLLNWGLHIFLGQKNDASEDSVSPGKATHHNDGQFASVPTPKELNEFLAFEQKYKKKYDGEQTRASKFAIFRDNLAFIENYNAKRKSGTDAILSMNVFGDLHFEDFKDDRKFRGLDLSLRAKNQKFLTLANLGTHRAQYADVPEEVDWVQKGGVTKVKNQGQCGSCWSFSTTGALEGAWFAAHGKLVSLAEQEFVDCDHVDNGCNGGLMDNAFQYAMGHDLCTEESYDYEAEEGKCHLEGHKKACDIAIKKGQITGFKDVQPHSEQALREALAQQPVSVAIEADRRVFQFYQEGVLRGDDCGSELDHGVLAVGYGNYKDPESGETAKYWKVKNSWGPMWGKEGYILISRDASKNDEGDDVGVCGIMSLPSYPVLAKGESPRLDQKTQQGLDQQTQQTEVEFI